MSPDLTPTNTFLGIMAAVSVLQVMAVIAPGVAGFMVC
jgi:hypothetical protein